MMDTGAETPTAVELIAHGLWVMAAGQCCPRQWETLSEAEKEWWRACALQAIDRWTRSVNAGYY
jgi:hypothetical protein